MYKVFIFDFDGTVGDSTACIIASYRATFAKHKLAAPSSEMIVSTMGLVLPEVLRILLPGQSDELYESLAKGYRSAYLGLLPANTRLYEGMDNLLHSLTTRGAICTIATSKITTVAELSCEHLGIRQYFKLIVGSDKVEQHKPHPDTVLYTLKQLNISTGEAVVIGDSTFDLEMAHAAGVACIGVSWGAHGGEELLTAKPLAVVDRPSELLEYIPEA